MARCSQVSPARGAWRLLGLLTALLLALLGLVRPASAAAPPGAPAAQIDAVHQLHEGNVRERTARGLWCVPSPGGGGLVWGGPASGSCEVTAHAG